MKNKFLLWTLFSTIFGGNIYSQGIWVQKANFPAQGREVSTSFAIQNKGYVGCGFNAGTYYNDFWEYDTAANAWTQKASFPGTARYGAVGFSIGNKGYIGTGWLGYVDFWEYDPATNLWTQKANFGGVARGFASGFSIGTKGYIGCGRSTGGVRLSDFWEWDQANNVWTKKNDCPVPRDEGVGVALNDKGYFSTGWNNTGYLNDMWEYDPLINYWKQKANFPAAARMDASVFAICNKIYICTGGEAPFYDDLWQFDPVANLWIQKANIPTSKRDDAAYFSIGNKGYLGLGQILGNTYGTDFWEYTPDSLCPTGLPLVNFTPSDTTFCGEGLRCIEFFDHSTNNPVSWHWLFPGAVPDSSLQQNPANICYSFTGTYSVTLIVSNAAGTDTLTISPMVTYSAGPSLPTITIKGDTLKGSPAYSYLWYFNGQPVGGATDSFYIAKSAGTYAVWVTDSLGCGKISNGVLFAYVDEMTDLSTIKVYPNPVTSASIIEFNIRLKNAEVIIYDMVGKEMIRKKLSGDRMEIEKGSLESGVYFLLVLSEDNQYAQKLIIE